MGTFIRRYLLELAKVPDSSRGPADQKLSPARSVATTRRPSGTTARLERTLARFAVVKGAGAARLADDCWAVAIDFALRSQWPSHRQRWAASSYPRRSSSGWPRATAPPLRRRLLVFFDLAGGSRSAVSRLPSHPDFCCAGKPPPNLQPTAVMREAQPARSKAKSRIATAQQPVRQPRPPSPAPTTAKRARVRSRARGGPRWAPGSRYRSGRRPLVDGRQVHGHGCTLSGTSPARAGSGGKVPSGSKRSDGHRVGRCGSKASQPQTLPDHRQPPPLLAAVGRSRSGARQRLLSGRQPTPRSWSKRRPRSCAGGCACNRCD